MENKELENLKKENQNLKEKLYLSGKRVEELTTQLENAQFDYETRDNECDHLHNQLEALKADVSAYRCEVKEARKSEQEALSKLKNSKYSDVVKEKAIEELNEYKEKYRVVKESNKELIKCCENFKNLCTELSETNDKLRDINKMLQDKIKSQDKEEPEVGLGVLEEDIFRILYDIVLG